MTRGLVVTSKTVDTGFNENQTEFRITIFAMTFKVLADGNGLFDELVKIFRNFGTKTVSLKDTENFVSGDGANLGDTVRISINRKEKVNRQLKLLQSSRNVHEGKSHKTT